jgi:hypothetical protein
MLFFLVATKTITAPTEIYLNEDLYYADGYSVTVSPAGKMAYTASKNLIQVSFTNATKTGDFLTIGVGPLDK